MNLAARNLYFIDRPCLSFHDLFGKTGGEEDDTNVSGLCIGKIPSVIIACFLEYDTILFVWKILTFCDCSSIP